MGPTASGKTDLAIALARRFDVSIISVDSAMVYKGMDIGTGKPDAATLKDYPHQLVDIRPPDEPYNANLFVQDAKAAIKKAHEENRLPLLVGGTMLYYRALLVGLSDLPSACPDTRQLLLDKATKLGWAALHEDLKRLDPISAKAIHPNDTQRLQRALEVYMLTNRPMSDFNIPTSPYSCAISIALEADRALIHERIAKRLNQMFESGFIEEAELIWHAAHHDQTLPSLRSVGYRQLVEHFKGEITLEEAKLKALYATRQLAKRQDTWLRNWPGLERFNINQSELLRNVSDLIRSKSCL